MIIVNSKQLQEHKKQSNQKINQPCALRQYGSVCQIQNQEQESIIEWIKQNFAQEYSHCRKINAIKDLNDGIAIAEIVSHFMANEEQKESFLNEIQILSKVQTHQQLIKAQNNLNQSISAIKRIFERIFQGHTQKKAQNSIKNDNQIISMMQISYKSIQRLKGEQLIGYNNKMQNFMMQIVMMLPQIHLIEIGQQFKSVNCQKKADMKYSTSRQNQRQALYRENYEVQQAYTSYANYNNLSQLSSIMITTSTVPMNERKFNSYSSNHNYYSSENDLIESNRYNKTTLDNKQKIYNQAMFNAGNIQQKQRAQQIKTQQDENNQIPEQYHFNSQNQQEFQQKVQRLIQWVQESCKINLSELKQPHLLLGQLVNAIFAQNGRLKNNQKPVKPSHYELGSYAVYNKVLNILIDIERLNKQNLIKLMKQVETGQVKEETFWSLIEDIYLMVKNKILPLKVVKKLSKQKSQGKRKSTVGTQKAQTEYDENINIDNIKNTSVTQLLKNGKELKLLKGQLKEAPICPDDLIKQTQLWLQQEMGMSHTLSKSKSNASTTILQNPLLNSTMFAKILQRLKIGSAKGIMTPSSNHNLKINLEIVKNELLKRGYQCARKLDIYKPSYNFYIALLSQIRQIHASKQNNTKQLLINDKKRRLIEESSDQILPPQRQQLQKWLLQSYNQSVEKINCIKTLSLNQLKTVIQSIINVNFLKQTTEKIQFSNYHKLIEFFRSIGFSHYCSVKVEDFVHQNHTKKSQNIRWMILRDLRLIKGDKTQISTGQFTQRS